MVLELAARHGADRDILLPTLNEQVLKAECEVAMVRGVFGFPFSLYHRRPPSAF